MKTLIVVFGWVSSATTVGSQLDGYISVMRASKFLPKADSVNSVLIFANLSSKMLFCCHCKHPLRTIIPQNKTLQEDKLIQSINKTITLPPIYKKTLLLTKNIIVFCPWVYFLKHFLTVSVCSCLYIHEIYHVYT